MTTLITSGTGKTGRRVAARLTALDLPVRVASRAGTPPFDWHAPETWGPTLDGVEAAYLAYAPDLALPGAAEVVAGFAEEAVRRGTRRLVLLSGRNEPGAQHAEKLVAAAGADWTVVRSAFFMQNFSEAFFADALAAGVLALPAGDVREPFVDADDVAEVAVAALTGDGHAGQVYEVTGPELLTFADAVATIARLAERPMAYLPVTAAAFVSAMAEAGVPAEEAAGIADLFAEVLDGRNAHLTDGVQRALRRSPRSFEAFAADAAAAGAWR